jgi:PKD repeat protein
MPSTPANPLLQRICILLGCILSIQSVKAQVPVINSFTPDAGAVGTSVVISGTNFNTTPASNTVYFGAVKGTVTAASATQLNVTVPVGASYQPITVTNNALTGYSAYPFTVTFASPDTFSANSFAPKVDFATNAQPYHMASGDLDGDGKTDILIGSITGSYIAVHRNTSTLGNISFAITLNGVFTGGVNLFLNLADLDGDGKLDIIATRNTASFMVLRNISTPGNISFASGITFSLGAGAAKAIATGDLDEDGKTDVVVTNQNQSKVCVFRNISSAPGIIAFDTRLDLTSGGLPYAASITDIDGDDQPEILVANASSVSFSVYRNTCTPGTLSFDPKLDFITGLAPYGLCPVDLDDDGQTDIAICNHNDNSISLFENTSTPGSISFEPKIDIATGAQPQNISAADLDGDGEADLAVGYNTGSASISVFKNTSTLGTLTLDPLSNYTTTGSNTYNILLNDLDGDGKPDMVSSAYFGNVISVLRNKINDPVISSFTPASAITGQTVTITGTNFTGTTAVSFGGAAASSFTVVSPTTITAIIGSGASGNVQVTTPNGIFSLAGFTYLPTPLITSFNPVSASPGQTVTITGTNFTGSTSVKFGGVNATSFTIVSPTTITAIVGTGASGSVSVSNINGTGSLPGFTFAQPLIANFSFTPGILYAPATVQFTDLSLGSINSWLWNFGNGQFSTLTNPQAFYTVPGAYMVTLRVANNTDTSYFSKLVLISIPPPVIDSFNPAKDTLGALVTIRGHHFGDTPPENIVYFGQVKATIANANDTTITVTVPRGASHQPITVTANNLTAYSSKSFIVTFAGGGNYFTVNSFQPKIDSATGLHPTHVAAADFDNDGKPDIAVANFGENSISVYQNKTTSNNISLAKRKNFATGVNPIAIATGDLDGDGRLDMAVANNQPPGSISVFRNISTIDSVLFAVRMDFPLTLTGSPYHIAIGDLNKDGKPDIAVADSGQSIAIFKNTGSPGNISFATSSSIGSFSPLSIFIGDINGDNQPEISVPRYHSPGAVSVHKNNSTVNAISFAVDSVYGAAAYTRALSGGDVDGDGKTDLVSASDFLSNKITILRNTGSGGNISFAPKVDTSTGNSPFGIAISDLDGDGKPDVTTANHFGNSVSLFKNTSSPGSISVLSKVNIATGNNPKGMVVTDLDGDGKPDIVTANSGANTISILRNNTGQTTSLRICPGGGGLLVSNLNGSSYQWQLNTGGGFVNITDNANYTGSNSGTLTLSNMPSSQYGNLYRCTVDGNSSDIFELKFENSFTGAVSTAWENPANWSCGSIPDGNTDVIIGIGQTVVLNSNAICRTLTLLPGVSFTINSGFVLTITH